MESVLQSLKECYVCGTTYCLHSHHIFYGTANRKISEKYGYKVFLCGNHHNMSDKGVHFDKKLDNHLKISAQKHFEDNHGSRNDFISIFGKSYI